MSIMKDEVVECLGSEDGVLELELSQWMNCGGRESEGEHCGDWNCGA